MEPMAPVAGLQKWRWLAAVLAALILLVCCVATRAPEERKTIERAFRELPEVQAFFGEVYTMSATMKPARVQWTGGVQSGYFVYDVRGRSARSDVMIQWEKPAASAPAAITKVITTNGQAIYPGEVLPGDQSLGVTPEALRSGPRNGASAPVPAADQR